MNIAILDWKIGATSDVIAMKGVNAKGCFYDI